MGKGKAEEEGGQVMDEFTSKILGILTNIRYCNIDEVEGLEQILALPEIKRGLELLKIVEAIAEKKGQP
jgi:hypothetical protein